MKIELNREFKQNKVYRIIRRAFILILASLCHALGVSMLLIPNKINIGGFTGISQTLAMASTPLGTGAWLIILNIPVLILAAFFLEKRFIFRTFVEVVLTGGFMELIRNFKLYELVDGVDGANVTILCIGGAVLVAIATAVTLQGSGSTGGSDIITIIIQKKYHESKITRLSLILDVIVISVYSAIAKDSTALFYSFTALAAYQIALEFILRGYGNAVMFEVITDNPKELINGINKELDRGATVFKGVGVYSLRERSIVICVVRKRQEAEARALIKRLAPDSFAYSVTVKEVIGKGFRNINY